MGQDTGKKQMLHYGTPGLHLCIETCPFFSDCWILTHLPSSAMMLLLDSFISNTCKCCALSACWAFGPSVQLLYHFPSRTASLIELGGGENPTPFPALTFYSPLVYKHAGTGGGWGHRGGKETKKERDPFILCWHLICHIASTIGNCVGYFYLS